MPDGGRVPRLPLSGRQFVDRIEERRDALLRPVRLSPLPTVRSPRRRRASLRDQPDREDRPRLSGRVDRSLIPDGRPDVPGAATHLPALPPELRSGPVAGIPGRLLDPRPRGLVLSDAARARTADRAISGPP